MSIAHNEQPVGVTGEVAHETGRSLGWWGMVFFIASESLLFANLIAGYLYLRVRAGTWPPPGGPQLDKPVIVGGNNYLIVINTVILLSSSIPMIFAGRAIRRGDFRRVPWLILMTIVLGVLFISLQGVEYATNGFGPSDGILGSTFYTLTGFHGAHVLVGLIFLLINFFRALRGQFTKEKHFALQAGEMYWHFVDIVWIFVFTLVYLI
ncbi:MAG TPA: cytochrome c oxidase subunit 3 [Ktedonobacterales bacterium]|nr:cytochrome c oxidase subunit 3 [Ktedonobacterales bacterium]